MPRDKDYKDTVFIGESRIKRNVISAVDASEER